MVYKSLYLSITYKGKFFFFYLIFCHKYRSRVTVFKIRWATYILIGDTWMFGWKCSDHSNIHDVSREHLIYSILSKVLKSKRENFNKWLSFFLKQC